MKTKPKLDPTQGKSELRWSLKIVQKIVLKIVPESPEAQEHVKIRLPATSKKPKKKTNTLWCGVLLH